MRTPETLLTQIAVGDIPCSLGDECTQAVASERAYWENHTSYEQYVTCLTAYIIGHCNRLVEAIGKSDAVERERLARALEFILLHRSAVTDQNHMSRMRTLVKRFEFDLCTIRSEEVDKKIDVHLHDLLKLILADE